MTGDDIEATPSSAAVSSRQSFKRQVPDARLRKEGRGKWMGLSEKCSALVLLRRRTRRREGGNSTGGLDIYGSPGTIFQRWLIVAGAMTASPQKTNTEKTACGKTARVECLGALVFGIMGLMRAQFCDWPTFHRRVEQRKETQAATSKSQSAGDDLEKRL